MVGGMLKGQLWEQSRVGREQPRQTLQFDWYRMAPYQEWSVVLAPTECLGGAQGGNDQSVFMWSEVSVVTCTS